MRRFATWSIIGLFLVSGHALAIEKTGITITVLYDNCEHDDSLQRDWGFSCLITGAEKTILFDTGAKGDLLLQNMAKMKIAPDAAEVAVISHNHDDHTGGLLSVLENSREMTVYLPSSCPESLLRKAKQLDANTVTVTQPVMICPGVCVVGPLGDEIVEQALAVNTDQGLVLITGCSHPGVIEMVKRAKKQLGRDVYMICGGLHLLQQSDEKISELIQELKSLGVQKVGPTHCTGTQAMGLFQAAFQDDCVELGVGRVLEIGTAVKSAERPVSERVQGREFPSVFQAWSPAQNVEDTSPLHTVARHDLVFNGTEFFGLRWNRKPTGLATGFTADSIAKAKSFRQQLLALNPNLILIAEIRYRDAHKSYLPDQHAWWLRDEQGHIVSGWDEGGYLCLDFHNPEFRQQVAQQAKAAVESGAVDGVMLDWWSDDANRLALIQEVRNAIGESAIILANANDRQTPETAPFINGYFMECTESRKPEDWKRIADTLTWAENHLREPRVNCLETWYHTSRDDLNLMRATTTLSLTHSAGYCLFSDPNPLPSPDHLHNWYPFWDRSLGKPVGKGLTSGDGTTRREFENGTVVYNPLGNSPVSVTFDEDRRSVATGKVSRSHDTKTADGDIFLKVKSP